MTLKDIKKIEITKDRFDCFLAMNKQFGENFRVYEDNGHYFNITKLDGDSLLDFVNSVPKLFKVSNRKKNRTHVVDHPFMSKVDQFEPGKQTLVIGLDVRALQAWDIYKVFIGNNRKVYYKIATAEALRLADQYKSIWTSPIGKKVVILPLKDFKRVERRIKNGK